MSPMSISCIVFVSVFGGALLGTLLQAVLPEHHLSAKSENVIKLGMGLVATMAALLLALLVASAQGTYSTERSELAQLSSDIILLDRALASYGPETKEARDLLRRNVVHMLNRLWPEDGTQPSQFEPVFRGEVLYKIQVLAPQNDAQRLIQAHALSLIQDVLQTNWLMFEQMGSSIPMPFLVVLVFWTTIIFVSFGIYAPPNTIVIAALFVCALSVSGAIFLTLELDRPYEGLLKISNAPLRNALAHLGQ